MVECLHLRQHGEKVRVLMNKMLAVSAQTCSTAHPAVSKQATDCGDSVLRFDIATVLKTERHMRLKEQWAC